jgi:UDP-glucose 4-epimerase
LHSIWKKDDKPNENEKMLFPINPYGRSKLFIEYMLKDKAKVEKDFKIALLRYCNPVAAHPSRKIGEDLKKIYDWIGIITTRI